MKIARNNKPNIYRWNFFGLGKQNLIVHLIRTIMKNEKPRRGVLK